MCFEFLYNFCLKHFSLEEEFIEILSKMYTSLPVEYWLLLSDFKETWIFWIHFLKNTQISKFMTPSNGCRIVPCGRTDGYDEPNVAFHNFAKAPNKGWRIYWQVCLALSPNESLVRRSTINHAHFYGACERGNLMHDSGIWCGKRFEKYEIFVECTTENNVTVTWNLYLYFSFFLVLNNRPITLEIGRCNCVWM